MAMCWIGCIASLIIVIGLIMLVIVRVGVARLMMVVAIIIVALLWVSRHDCVLGTYLKSACELQIEKFEVRSRLLRDKLGKRIHPAGVAERD